ncbi:PAC2 family protein [uncultured Tessaracoccus sp.]|uniref:PAC2 family protein n=1 Tax=uncultured Tessaracoccus sp. TaxID=905023 RepID=UPI0025DA43E4|nr:PAC2 family protein [uncultured Tessaracoccus sp.]
MDLEPLTDLRDPVVVIAFSGWNDAANAASDVVEHLVAQYPGDELMPIDDEHYFDFQATRPVLHRAADGPWIEWPSIRLRRLRHPERDIVAVLGPEPNLRWRSFCRAVVERVRGLRPDLVVTIGAMLSDTPHSRPFPTGLYTTNETLRERLGFETSSYEGPVGIVGVLGQAVEQAGVPSAALWVSVPHYVASPPNPQAQLQLLGRLESVLGIDIDHGDLEPRAQEWVEAVDAIAGQDPDIEEYIEQLEEARDQEVVEENSGDRIAAEFERYLRGQRDG